MITYQPLTGALLNLLQESIAKSNPPGEISRFSGLISTPSLRQVGGFQAHTIEVMRTHVDSAPKGASIGAEVNYMETMVEPSLERCPYGELLISDFELLLMSQKKIDEHAASLQTLQETDAAQNLIKEKRKVDAFYKSRVMLPVTVPTLLGAEVTLFATASTAPYLPGQMLFIAPTGRTDIQEILLRNPADSLIEEEYEQEKAAFKPAVQLKHETHIVLFLNLLKQLSPGCVLAQNSPDSGSAKKHLHFHYVQENAAYPIPIFTVGQQASSIAASSTSSALQSIKMQRLRDYPGTVYKFTFPEINDSIVTNFQRLIQTFLQHSDNQHTVISLIGRRTEVGFELCCTLRKDIRYHPGIIEAVQKIVLHPKNPQKEIPEQHHLPTGWLQHAGIFITGYSETAESYTERHHRELLDFYKTEEAQCKIFETCAHDAFLTLKPLTTQSLEKPDMSTYNYIYDTQVNWEELTIFIKSNPSLTQLTLSPRENNWQAALAQQSPTKEFLETLYAHPNLTSVTTYSTRNTAKSEPRTRKKDEIVGYTPPQVIMKTREEWIPKMVSVEKTRNVWVRNHNRRHSWDSDGWTEQQTFFVEEDRGHNEKVQYDEDVGNKPIYRQVDESYTHHYTMTEYSGFEGKEIQQTLKTKSYDAKIIGEYADYLKRNTTFSIDFKTISVEALAKAVSAAGQDIITRDLRLVDLPNAQTLETVFRIWPNLRSVELLLRSARKLPFPLPLLPQTLNKVSLINFEWGKAELQHLAQSNLAQLPQLDLSGATFIGNGAEDFVGAFKKTPSLQSLDLNCVTLTIQQTEQLVAYLKNKSEALQSAPTVSRLSSADQNTATCPLTSLSVSGVTLEDKGYLYYRDEFPLLSKVVELDKLSRTISSEKRVPVEQNKKLAQACFDALLEALKTKNNFFEFIQKFAIPVMNKWLNILISEKSTRDDHWTALAKCEQLAVTNYKSHFEETFNSVILKEIKDDEKYLESEEEVGRFTSSSPRAKGLLSKLVGMSPEFVKSLEYDIDKAFVNGFIRSNIKKRVESSNPNTELFLASLENMKVFHDLNDLGQSLLFRLLYKCQEWFCYMNAKQLEKVISLFTETPKSTDWATLNTADEALFTAQKRYAIRMVRFYLPNNLLFSNQKLKERVIDDLSACSSRAELVQKITALADQYQDNSSFFFTSDVRQERDTFRDLLRTTVHSNISLSIALPIVEESIEVKASDKKLASSFSEEPSEVKKLDSPPIAAAISSPSAPPYHTAYVPIPLDGDHKTQNEAFLDKLKEKLGGEEQFNKIMGQDILERIVKYQCPISLQLMDQPVAPFEMGDKQSGIIFDKASIESVLTPVHPVSKKLLMLNTSGGLIYMPSLEMKDGIDTLIKDMENIAEKTLQQPVANTSVVPSLASISGKAILKYSTSEQVTAVTQQQSAALLALPPAPTTALPVSANKAPEEKSLATLAGKVSDMFSAAPQHDRSIVIAQGQSNRQLVCL
jgi:hypothetical protein